MHTKEKGDARWRDRRGTCSGGAGGSKVWRTRCSRWTADLWREDKRGKDEREGRSPEGNREWWEEKDEMKAWEGGVDGKEWLRITGEREKGAQDADRCEPRACAT